MRHGSRAVRLPLLNTKGLSFLCVSAVNFVILQLNANRYFQTGYSQSQSSLAQRPATTSCSNITSSEDAFAADSSHLRPRAEDLQQETERLVSHIVPDLMEELNSARDSQRQYLELYQQATSRIQQIEQRMLSVRWDYKNRFAKSITTQHGTTASMWSYG